MQHYHVTVPFLIAQELWCSDLGLPQEPLLSLGPTLTSSENGRQDIATIIFRLLTYPTNTDGVPLDDLLPGVKLRLKGLKVKRPAESASILDLGIRIENADDLLRALRSNREAFAFLNGGEAKYADSFLVLDTHSEIRVLLLVQSKRVSGRHKGESDNKFMAEYGKVIPPVASQFATNKLEPIFVYITDAKRVTVTETAQPENTCIITAAHHEVFYGKYRTTLRRFRGQTSDDPKRVRQKQAGMVKGIMDKARQGKSLGRVQEESLRICCEWEGIPVTSKEGMIAAIQAEGKKRAGMESQPKQQGKAKKGRGKASKGHGRGGGNTPSSRTRTTVDEEEEAEDQEEIEEEEVGEKEKGKDKARTRKKKGI